MSDDGIFVIRLVAGAFFVMPLHQSGGVVLIHVGLAVVSLILFIIYIIYTGIAV